MVDFQVHMMHIIRYLGGVLAPSSHCSILIETPLAGKASQENNLSIAAMGSNNSKFNQFGLCLLKIFKEFSGHIFSHVRSFYE
jgi:hypothetical protein